MPVTLLHQWEDRDNTMTKNPNAGEHFEADWIPVSFLISWVKTRLKTSPSTRCSFLLCLFGWSLRCFSVPHRLQDDYLQQGLREVAVLQENLQMNCRPYPLRQEILWKKTRYFLSEDGCSFKKIKIFSQNDTFGNTNDSLFLFHTC